MDSKSAEAKSDAKGRASILKRSSTSKRRSSDPQRHESVQIADQDVSRASNDIASSDTNSQDLLVPSTHRESCRPSVRYLRAVDRGFTSVNVFIAFL